MSDKTNPLSQLLILSYYFTQNKRHVSIAPCVVRIRIVLLLAQSDRLSMLVLAQSALLSVLLFAQSLSTLSFCSGLCKYTAMMQLRIG